MQYKRFLIDCNKNYTARIFRCPDIIDLFDFTLHWHRDYEFIYVEKGPLTVQKLDCEITLNDGDVYFINSEELHSYSGVTGDLRFLVINFPPKAIQPYIENPKDVPTFCIESKTARKEISKSLKRLMDCKNFDDRLELLKIKAVLNNASYYLVDQCQKSELSFIKGSESDDFLCAKSAILYMEQNYRKNIPLAEIANYVGMTPAHFSKYFKEKTKVTFSKYLSRLRLEHAINDIIADDAPVKTAALNNGFPNVNSLIMCCKTEYGKTPTELKSYRSNT